MGSLVPKFWLIVGALGAAVAVDQMVAQDEISDWKGKPLIISLQDDDLGDSKRLREFGRLLDRAEKAKVSMIIFDLDFDRPAYDLDFQNAIERVAALAVPTVSYVSSSAIGPGALVALGSDSIYMSVSAIIGSAAIESLAADDDSKESQQIFQAQSILKARARSLATEKGHRIDVAEAFVDRNQKIDAPWGRISEEGEILTLTADEAVKKIEGKPLLAKGIAESIGEVIRAEKVRGEPVETSPRDFAKVLNRERLSGVEAVESVTRGAEGKASGESDSSLFGRREEGSYAGKIVVVDIGEDSLATGKASFDFMDRTLKKAELDGAEAVIFDMDTPGGFAWYTEGLVLDSLQSISYPTYTFVNTRAESAGAIIAVGTSHIYMRPAATIGSALVVTGSGQDLNESMNDKVTQMIIAAVRNAAELNGHNPDVAEAFVTREKEVRIDGEVIHEAGNVLNLNTIEATEIIDGRPLLAKGVARNLQEIIKQEGLEGEIVNARPLGMEAFAHWIQKLSVLLIVVGLAGAYLEINSPGFGLPGLVSVLAFGLFFFGNYMAGNLAGYELAVLLVLGLVLIGVEVFLFPGAIIPGAVGAALVHVALGLAMVDRVDLEWKWNDLPGADSWAAIFRQSFFMLSLGLVGALLAVLSGMRFIPHTRFGNRLILEEAVASGASIEVSEIEAKKDSYVGLSGMTTTDLLPSGKGKFDGKYLDIVADGEFIKKGEIIEIVQHEGSRIVVSRK
jgi:membrane-bound serine protease (ClpP class)